MTDYSDLVERLRKLDFVALRDGHHGGWATVDEAASAIEAQRERIELYESALKQICVDEFYSETGRTIARDALRDARAALKEKS